MGIDIFGNGGSSVAGAFRHFTAAEKSVFSGTVNWGGEAERYAAHQSIASGHDYVDFDTDDNDVGSTFFSLGASGLGFDTLLISQPCLVDMYVEVDWAANATGNRGLDVQIARVDSLANQDLGGVFLPATVVATMGDFLQLTIPQVYVPDDGPWAVLVGVYQNSGGALDVTYADVACHTLGVPL